MLTLRARMHEHFRYRTSKEETEQADRKPKVRPIVSVLHNFQCIALEVDGTIEIHFMEGFHWYLTLPMVFGTVILAMEM